MGSLPARSPTVAKPVPLVHTHETPAIALDAPLLSMANGQPTRSHTSSGRCPSAATAHARPLSVRASEVRKWSRALASARAVHGAGGR